MMKVRTRFAPSPTGHVHIGNIRTAIYNWLFARHHGGQFLLRVEDTDRERSTPEAVQVVHDAMAWLGLDVDEEPVSQSANMDAHLEAAELLLSKGLAYKADKGGTGQGEAVIFKMPEEDVSFDDQIKGRLAKKAEHMQDLVIVRSNGTPVFHLANIVDDINMGITHVIRGDDHVENTYRHIAVYKALGAPLPQFAHLPMIVNQQGKPYSKRDGDAFVGDFREKGFFAEALFNYLVLLGWSGGDDQEIFSRDALVERFDFAGCQSSPAQMDMRKLEWMNGEYLRALPDDAYKSGVLDALKGVSLEGAPVNDILGLLRDRLRFFHDAESMGGYFFSDDFAMDEKAVRKRLHKEGVDQMLRQAQGALAAVDDFKAEALHAALNTLAEAEDISLGKLNPAIRVAVSGQPGGPDLFEILALLGKEKVVARLDRAIADHPGC
jgi:glutamyl-tRNA synthetase